MTEKEQQIQELEDVFMQAIKDMKAGKKVSVFCGVQEIIAEASENFSVKGQNLAFGSPRVLASGIARFIVDENLFEAVLTETFQLLTNDNHQEQTPKILH